MDPEKSLEDFLNDNQHIEDKQDFIFNDEEIDINESLKDLKNNYDIDNENQTNIEKIETNGRNENILKILNNV